MPFVPAVNAAKVVVEYLWANQHVEQTFWFQFNAVPALSDLNALATHVGTNWWNSMLTSSAGSIAMIRVTATRQQSSSDIQGQYVPASPVFGTGSGASMPNNCTCVITHRTSSRGRNFRGRSYQPGLLNSILTSSIEANLTTLGGIASNYVGHFITSVLANWTWVVASHFLNKVARPSALLTPVVGTTVNTSIDSQRRRLLGRGQ